MHSKRKLPYVLFGARLRIPGLSGFGVAAMAAAVLWTIALTPHSGAAIHVSFNGQQCKLDPAYVRPLSQGRVEIAEGATIECHTPIATAH
ncbi:hypothetical protein [Paraburkholderia youngii]|uniref:hypothetical protein n=1 Tax=Paraburkholderia youngii TaxID=2782701 RepID=UPI003D1CA939